MPQFTLTRDDFEALNKCLTENVTKKPPLLSKAFFMRVGVWVSIAFIFYSFFKAYAASEAATVYLIQLAVGATLLFVIATVAQVQNQKTLVAALISPQGWFLSPQSVQVDKDGIKQTSKLGEAHFTWRAFMKYREDQERFYLFIEPGQGFVLPKRAIPDNETWNLIRANVQGEA